MSCKPSLVVLDEMLDMVPQLMAKIEVEGLERKPKMATRLCLMSQCSLPGENAAGGLEV